MLLKIYVVVNFLSQVIFVFLLFLGMLMYANEVKTKGKIKITWDKKLTTTYILLACENAIVTLLTVPNFPKAIK